MKDLLLHTRTRKQIEDIIQHPPHGILITGRAGSGKKTAAINIACNLLGLTEKQLNNHPYFYSVDNSEKYISIEEIRSLQQFLKLKVPISNKRAVNRIVLIEDSQRMRTEAQNALLKTLEEPPIGTVLILTSESSESLLPTITSRTTQLEILPVSNEDALKYFDAIVSSKADIGRHYALSQGQAGLLSALINDESNELVEQVKEAKLILTRSIGERLLMSDGLARDKENVRKLLNALLRITHAALTASAGKEDQKSIAQWIKRQQYVLQSIELLNKNVQAKLVLDNLFINI